MERPTHRMRDLRHQGALAVLRHLHRQPGVTRSELARALDLSSGSATDLVARLKRLRLLDEVASAPSGGRGRPSPTLVAHLAGPLVCVVDISHERWRVAAVELGGRIVQHTSGRHVDREPDAVLDRVRREIAACRRRLGHRIRAVSVAVAATVRGTEVVQAATLGWRRVSLEPLRPAADVPLLVGNDASLAGLAEARRGAGAGVRVVLHLTVEVGVGGVLVVDGDLLDGATEAGGEFGHLPFGDPTLRCPCGATGCWDLLVDGRAMARQLGQPAPDDPRTAAEHILAAAPRDPAARAAVDGAARALGRGVGGLVNALDPALVTLSGLAVDLSAAAPREVDAGYRAGLMSFRRGQPPPLVPSTLGPDGRIAGAADAAFDTVLTVPGIESWSRSTARVREGAT
ncbi:ROK family transcriptional regulator [Micromonospora globbae]|uniref:ROK family transcriptional regulator n=1 Tax=Micromonospora globbae TaxID=1894969 RepID=UPI00342189E8